MTLVMNRYLGIVLFLVIFPALVIADQFKCTRVTDGDTINVISNGQKRSFVLSESMLLKLLIKNVNRVNPSAKNQQSILPILS